MVDSVLAASEVAVKHSQNAGVGSGAALQSGESWSEHETVITLGARIDRLTLQFRMSG